MKKRIALLLAITMATLTLMGCGSSNQPDNTTAEATTEDTADATEDTDAADATDTTDDTSSEEGTASSAYSVCWMIPGNLGDKSFFDAAFSSIAVLKEELGIEASYIEVGTDTTKYYPTFVDLCEQDYDLILTISSNCDDALIEAAEEYPDQLFVNLDTDLEEAPDNVYIMSTHSNEMSYLAGVAAALKAKELNEDTIGFIGGMDIPGINEFLVGYIDGAQYVNPDIKVNSSYVGSFTDSAAGKEKGLLQFNSGVSIIYAAAGQSGLGVIDAAVEKGKLIIGVDSDQAMALKDNSPEMADVIITSAMKMISNMTVDVVSRAMDNNVNFGSREVFGLTTGSVGIAKNEYYEKLLNEEQRSFIDETEEKIKSGEVEIVETQGMTTDKINEIRESVRP